MYESSALIIDYLKKASDGLRIWEDGNSPTAVPENFIRISREDLLQNGALWKSFVSCFRDVFGRSDIWGEGFICESCFAVIPVDKPSEKCACGGLMVDFHSEPALCERITAELAPPSFCTLLLSEAGGNEVLGFSLGFIGGVDRLSKYIASDKHVSGYEKSIEHALADFQGIMFFDETGIKQGNRFGAAQVIVLTRLAFESACREGVTSSITWTSRNSPIYKICLAIGYVEILETETGIVFLLLKDFIPALKLIQNKSPMECAKVLVRLFRLIDA